MEQLKSNRDFEVACEVNLKLHERGDFASGRAKRFPKAGSGGGFDPSGEGPRELFGGCAAV